MSESKASRTLLKSPPELWSEVSTAASLQRHMDHFGEIRITKLEPETAVAWEGEHARGTITLEVSGWGTKVNLTAEPVGTGEVQETEPEVAGVVGPEPADEVNPPEPDGNDIKPEVAVDRVEPEIFDARVEQRPRWTRRLALAFRKWLSAPPPQLDADPVADGAEPEPAPPAASPTAPEPQVSAPAPAPVAPPEPAPQQPPPPQLDDASTAALDAALNSLGQAHHRPFSRA